MNDGSRLERFIEAQRADFDRARAELAAGRKRSHWIWYIFPQLRGLGRSETSRFYGIADLAEAREYLAHPVLGSRLVECVSLVLGHDETTAEDIFGEVDAMKFQSSMTLFAAAGDTPDLVFRRALARFYGGNDDTQTIAVLSRP